jgi:asparagine synthase (glutamine-hydrolysing)
MLAAIKHRGPDGAGAYLDAQCAIGAVRLSIVDLKRGAQPFVANCQRFVAAFNGEILNHHYLRILLEQKGVSFQTSSDGEVIANCVAVFGQSFIEPWKGNTQLSCMTSGRKKSL